MIDQKTTIQNHPTIQIQAATPQLDLSDIRSVARAMNDLKRYALSFSPWTTKAYPQKVAFAIAYQGDTILLKFFIEHDLVRAFHTQVNGEVWHDSCVEFFISPDASAYYYNIEFNCIGTGRVGYGISSTDRILLDSAVINRINYFTEIRSERGIHSNWEITLCIPTDLFIFNDTMPLSGHSYRANFYKCGDATPHPHFITWSNIESAVPNFHLPAFFGTLNFE